MFKCEQWSQVNLVNIYCISLSNDFRVRAFQSFLSREGFIAEGKTRIYESCFFNFQNIFLFFFLDIFLGALNGQPIWNLL